MNWLWGYFGLFSGEKKFQNFPKLSPISPLKTEPLYTTIQIQMIGVHEISEPNFGPISVLKMENFYVN